MPTFYKIADLQITGRYFADGELFENEEEIREQLADYHSIDWEDEEREITELTLPEILEHG